MNSDLQKKIFIEEEADNWFDRNLSAIENFNGDEEAVYPIIKRYQLQPKRILEIGCSAGHRLVHLKQKFPGAKVCGIEPSLKAINYGKEKFGLTDDEIIQGTADQLEDFADSSFDLIIIGFVFYVIDRNLLYKIIHSVDRLLCNTGHLVSIDFYAVSPLRKKYHHVDNPLMFSYKQRYEDIFTSSHLYHLICKDTFDISTKQYNADSDFDNKYTVVLLTKDDEQAYH